MQKAAAQGEGVAASFDVPNKNARMRAAMPGSWVIQDAGERPVRCKLIGFVVKSVV